jgi:hypothetical protein
MNPSIPETAVRAGRFSSALVGGGRIVFFHPPAVIVDEIGTARYRETGPAKPAFSAF